MSHDVQETSELILDSFARAMSMQKEERLTVLAPALKSIAWHWHALPCSRQSSLVQTTGRNIFVDTDDRLSSRHSKQTKTTRSMFSRVSSSLYSSSALRSGFRPWPKDGGTIYQSEVHVLQIKEDNVFKQFIGLVLCCWIHGTVLFCNRV